jgi:hypothetical protein
LTAAALPVVVHHLQDGLDYDGTETEGGDDGEHQAQLAILPLAGELL